MFLSLSFHTILPSPLPPSLPHSPPSSYAMYISPELLAKMPALTVLLDGGVNITIPSDQYTQVGREGGKEGRRKGKSDR